MGKHLIFIKNSFMGAIVYKFQFVISFFSSIIFCEFTYFLWDAIYKNPDNVLNGLTFKQTFSYMALAMSLFVLYKTSVEWQISKSIIDGSIITSIMKPIHFRSQLFFTNLGIVLFNLATVTIPYFLVLIVFFGIDLPFGSNIVIVAISVFMAYIISFSIDYIVGLISFYTESIWGLSITKDTIILLLSGLLVPIDFYPEVLRNLLDYLPFKAIYNIPVTILTSQDILMEDYISLLSVQLFWVIVISFAGSLLYKIIIKSITLNGG